MIDALMRRFCAIRGSADTKTANCGGRTIALPVLEDCDKVGVIRCLS